MQMDVLQELTALKNNYITAVAGFVLAFIGIHF